jgi:hypothetical protein
MSYALIYNPRLILNFHSIHYQLDKLPSIISTKCKVTHWYVCGWAQNFYVLTHRIQLQDWKRFRFFLCLLPLNEWMNLYVYKTMLFFSGASLVCCYKQHTSIFYLFIVSLSTWSKIALELGESYTVMVIVIQELFQFTSFLLFALSLWLNAS